jgi:hypothetical protein
MPEIHYFNSLLVAVHSVVDDAGCAQESAEVRALAIRSAQFRKTARSSARSINRIAKTLGGGRIVISNGFDNLLQAFQ